MPCLVNKIGLNVFRESLTLRVKWGCCRVTGVPMPRAAAVQLRCRDERSLVSRLLPARLGAQKAWSAITEPAMWACAEVLIRSFSGVDTSGSNFWPMSFATRIGIKIERAPERRTRDQALERIPTPSMKPIVQSLMMTG